MATTYATIADVQARLSQTMSTTELGRCEILLEDAAVIIDNYCASASEDAKKVVSCRMVSRVVCVDPDPGVPVGATQGSMSGLGYSQSWTVSGGGSTGELYLSKLEKDLLRRSTGDNRIGFRSPIEYPNEWGCEE